MMRNWTYEFLSYTGGHVYGMCLCMIFGSCAARGEQNRGAWRVAHGEQMNKWPYWLAILIGSMPVSLVVLPIIYLRDWWRGRDRWMA